MARAEELLHDAMALPIEERSQMAEALLDSLMTREEEAVAAEWAEVAEERIDELERGLVKTIPFEETRVRARAAVAAVRQNADRDASRR